jgi:hypothetical protein
MSLRGEAEAISFLGGLPRTQRVLAMTDRIKGLDGKSLNLGLI